MRHAFLNFYILLIISADFAALCKIIRHIFAALSMPIFDIILKITFKKTTAQQSNFLSFAFYRIPF